MSENKFRFQSALVQGKWQKNVVISVKAGLVTEIEPQKTGAANDETNDRVVDLSAVALPGMVNVHSHAFQRAFAGLSEYRTGQRDSFWTWRRLMYDFLLHLDPDDVYVIAKQLYLEMLRAGYTWVGEFHYLHNPVGGGLYEQPEEMSLAIARAARDAGIGLCHLPVLYQRGGFENESLSEGQRRFGLTNDQFLDLVQRCRDQESVAENYRVGIAFHSLRAVSSDNGNEVLKSLNVMDAVHAEPAVGFSGPIHLHIAEQMQEVNDCRSVHELRPVEYLYSEQCGWMASRADRWCLIHATHLSSDEVQMIAHSNAVVGLCPTTESNLGDGFFSARDFLERGGEIAIGSDSNVSVDLSDELRTLEYGQRLRLQQRSVLGTDLLSVGRRLYESAARGGMRALRLESSSGLATGEIAVGERADFTLVAPEHASIVGAHGDRILDRLVFCNIGGSPICGTIVGGRLNWNGDEERRELERNSRAEFAALSQRLVK